MNQSAGKYQYLVRFIYAMMAILVVTALIAFAILYAIHSADRKAHQRITFFHAQSTALAQQLHASSQSILRLLDAGKSTAAAQGLSITNFSRPGSDMQATLREMSDEIGLLQELQSQFDGDEFGATLERVATRLVAIEQSLVDSKASSSTFGLLSNFDLAVEQFNRQHVIASADALDDIDAISHRVIPSVSVIALLLLMIGLITWFMGRQLRKSLARQLDIEEALADSQARMFHMQKLDALGQFVGGIAHDFNNLLTAILGHTGLLLDKPSIDDDLEFSLSQIQLAGQQAASLTKQLLTFGRPEAAETCVINLNDLVHQIEDLLQRLIGENVELVIQPGDSLDPVEMDPGQLQQVLLNLAVNARDAMPEGGQLTIKTMNVHINEPEAAGSTIPVGDYVKLMVLDTGTGMDTDTQERIFDPYFTTKPKDRGTGLGLSIVHGIIVAAEGRIRVFSQRGSGSRFEIYLPRSEKPHEKFGNNSLSTQNFTGTETILIVEDEEQIRTFLKDGLSSLGYRVLMASDAGPGLKICRSERGEIHVIVSDVILPHSNGVEFLKEAQRLRPSAAGIFISGYTDDVLLRSGIESSQTPLMYKPFELGALASLIRQRLDNTIVT